MRQIADPLFVDAKTDNNALGLYEGLIQRILIEFLCVERQEYLEPDELYAIAMAATWRVLTGPPSAVPVEVRIGKRIKDALIQYAVAEHKHWLNRCTLPSGATPSIGRISGWEESLDPIFSSNAVDIQWLYHRGWTPPLIRRFLADSGVQRRATPWPYRGERTSSPQTVIPAERRRDAQEALHRAECPTRERHERDPSISVVNVLQSMRIKRSASAREQLLVKMLFVQKFSVPAAAEKLGVSRDTIERMKARLLDRFPALHIGEPAAVS